MTVHAFVDESKRGRVYLVSAVVTEPAQLTSLRQAMRSLLLPGQRELHFHNEKEPRQRQLADAIARLPVEVHIYTMSTSTRSDEPARAACPTRLTEDLVARGAQRLVIDTRQERDKLDERVIRAVLGKQPSRTQLVYEHMDSRSECLLWIADAAGWCYGAGRGWRQRIAGIIASVVELDARPR